MDRAAGEAVSGKFSRRNPAMVTLSDAHVAIIDAIAIAYLGVPRTRLVANLIERALPSVLADLKSDKPETYARVSELAAALRGHVERKTPLPVGVVDLAHRRFERKTRERRQP